MKWTKVYGMVQKRLQLWDLLENWGQLNGGRRSWHRNMEKHTQYVMYKNVEKKKIGKYALTRNIQM